MKTCALIFIMLCVLGFAPVQAGVTVKKTDTFEEVARIVDKQQLRYGIDEILLVFDIDNTLLSSSTDLGSDVWYQWQAGQFKELMPTPEQKVDCFYQDAIGLLYALGPMQVTEANVPTLINQWQQRGYTLMALTSRSPKTRGATERELARAGIDLSKTALAPQGSPTPTYRYIATGKGKSKTAVDKTVNRREISYMKGIMMTSGMHKGSMLDHILEKTDRHFDAIVFVDDTYTNIERVQESFQRRREVDVTAVHYTRIEHQRKEVYGAVLTREQTEKMAADWVRLQTVLGEVFPERVGQACSP